MHLVLILTPLTFTFWHMFLLNFFLPESNMQIFQSLALIANVDTCWIQMRVFSEGLPREKHWSLKASLLFDLTCTVLYCTVHIERWPGRNHFWPAQLHPSWWGEGPDSRRSPNRRLARSPPPPGPPPRCSPRAPTPPPPRRSRRTRSCRWSLEPPWGRLGVKGVWLESLQSLLKLLFRRLELGVFCANALCQLWTVLFKKLFSENAFLWYFVKHRATSKSYLCLIQLDHKSCWALSRNMNWE